MSEVLEQNNSTLESRMKLTGEQRVWKAVFKDTESPMTLPQTQLGQQLIFKEAVKILPKMQDWIRSTSHFKELIVEMPDEDAVIQKIVETMLFLTKSEPAVGTVDSAPRHTYVRMINERILTKCSLETTWKFVEAVVDFSKYFKVVLSKGSAQGTWKNKVTYTCTMPDLIRTKLSNLAHSAFFPEPMLEKPLEWSFKNKVLVGGYKTFQYPLVRHKSIDVNHGRYGQTIFDAVNRIQAVPWVVNQEVLEVLVENIAEPDPDEYLKTPFLEIEEGFFKIDQEKLNEKELAEYLLKKEEYLDAINLSSAEKLDLESAVGKYRAVILAITIAQKYRHCEEIYFPHSYDFRGRIYPICVGLSPQGSDAVKALIKYKEGEVLTDRGVEWAWAYLASLYGDDKLDFESRIQRGKELINAKWSEAEEPYQFLSHQIEVQRLVRDRNYKFNGRVHLDACNSGSQFASTITGDIAGCVATNVIPTIEDGKQVRQDAYLLVADRSLQITNELLQDIENDNKSDEEEKIDAKEHLTFFRELLISKGRKMCKTPVMVSNYGGTAGGRVDLVRAMLRNLGVDRKFSNRKVATLYSNIIGQGINGVLNGGKMFEKYIQSMSNILTKIEEGGNPIKPIEWSTRDGFKVQHIRKKEKAGNKVTFMLPGSRKTTTLVKTIYLNELSESKMRSAISPNFIHTLDAELLRGTMMRMYEQGIVNTDWIHDSFGCLPNHVDMLLTATKEEFVHLMSQEPLVFLDKELRAQASDIDSLKKIKTPAGNKIDLSGTLKSEWFFS